MDEIDYYKYIINSEDLNKDILVQLTSLTSNPNLVVSYNASNQFPIP